MEKVLRRSILRRNHILKQNRRADLKSLRKEWREHNSHKQSQDRIINDLVKQERIARREDWQLGPLAPNREAGYHRGRYGVTDSVLAQAARIPKRYLQGPRGLGEDATGSEDKNIFPNGEWSGQGIQGNVVLGDRVVVIRGRPGVKGMIGKVSKIDHDANAVTIKQVNMADLEVPAYMLSKKEKFYTSEIPISMADIRLVTKLYDEATGVDKDYIVKHVYAAQPYIQRDAGSSLPRHTRYIAGLDTEIPWPKEESDRQFSHDGDTRREEVETDTYTPSFDHLPMFEGVIDELRGKYSRERTSHDDMEWIQRKIIEDARESWLKSRVDLVAGRRPYTPATGPRAERRRAKEMQETLELVSRMQSINLVQSSA